MDKKAFVNLVQLEDKNTLSNLFDKYTIAYKTGKNIYSNEFYTPNVWRNLQRNQENLGVKVHTYGLFEEAERRMIVFSMDENFQFPIKVLRIKNKSKFSQLGHKDYLGAIMSLGINREKLGDIVLSGEFCYLPICNEISNYVFTNLNTIGKNPCSFEFLDEYEEILPKINFQQQEIIVSSTRLDCVISCICNISRNSTMEMIDSGKVLLDYEVVKSKEKKVIFGNVVIVRGYGKFKIDEEKGNTQKGRIRILIKKYI